jgi:predicted membrane metal-binding protein
VRAAMGSIGLVGQAVGRRQAGANTLVFTAAVMCAFNPHVLFDAGFMLSFAATLSLILYADLLKAWFTALGNRILLVMKDLLPLFCSLFEDG